VVDWKKLEEKLEKKLDVWQGNSLSMGGRSVLIKVSCPMPLFTTCRCSSYLKQLFWRWRKLEGGFSGRVVDSKRSITLSGGRKCVELKNMVV
jgi:hypothetical protein